MARAELKQTVRFFCDQNKKTEQEVTLETNSNSENWLVVEHAGSEISLSLENFEKLNQLVQNAKKLLKIN